MGREPDSWDQPIGAEVYGDSVRFGTIHRTLAGRLVDWVELPRGGRLLDLGCGTGIAAELVSARAPRATVAGIDRALAMLRVARAGVPLDTACFALAAPERLPFVEGAFDAAISSAAFWHFPFWRQVFAETHRAVRRTGRMALNVPAAQLSDVDDAFPAPLQRALASAGERAFGRSPSPSAIEMTREELVAGAEGAAWQVAGERVVDVRAKQRELTSLLAVPAIGARFYPEASREERDRWIEDALRAVDPDEAVTVRWWELCLAR